MRRAQDAGELDSRLDPELLTLFTLSLVTGPHALPQLTRVIAGALPSAPASRRRQLAFADRVVTLLAPLYSAQDPERKRRRPARPA